MTVIQSRIGRLSVIALACAITAPIARASAIVVDDDGGVGVQFTSLQAAINASANGGLILVKGGTYSSFTVDGKSLVITADMGADVKVNGSAIIRNIAANQSFAMSGIGANATGTGDGLTIADCAGPVLVENASFLGDGIQIFLDATGGVITNSAAVTLTDCHFGVTITSGSTPGLKITASTVSLYFCSALGGSGAAVPLGATGCQVQGSVVFASGSTFRGGDGSDGTLTAPFMTCTSGFDGGAGITVSSTAVTPLVRLLDCDLIGGAGGAPGGPSCSPGAAGPSELVISGSIVHLNGDARSYDISSPAREGTIGFINLAGDPGEYVWIFLSPVQLPNYSNTWKGTLLPGVPQFVIFLGQLPASGNLNLNVPVPVDPSLACFTLYEQAIYHRPSTGFVASNPRLGVVLDGSL